MKQDPNWAVCPRPDDLHGMSVRVPKLFESESLARRFLNSRARRPWLKDLGSQERRERIRAWNEGRAEALRKWKADGRKPFGFPERFRIIRNKDQGWGDPVPIRSLLLGTKSDRLFREFLSSTEIGVIAPEDISRLLRRVFSGTMPDYTCFLGSEWRFEEVEKDASKRVGHQFEGRKFQSIAEIVLKALYDLEIALLRIHPDLSATSASEFWTSWNIQRHMAEFTDNIKDSPTALALSREPRSAAHTARDWLNVQLAAYAHEITPMSTSLQLPSKEPQAPRRQESKKPRFPRRAIWLRDRLRERSWDRNDPYRSSGPDRKTVQKILDGEFVRPDMLRKLIVALNHNKVDKHLSVLDVPSD